MFNLEFLCDACGGKVEILFKATVDDYAEHLGFKIIGENEKIDLASIPNYLIYRCTACTTEYKLTLAEYEERIRHEMAKLALNYRRLRVFARNRDHLDIDSGMEFCGLCGGVDETKNGYCIKSLMQVCDIRRDHLEKEANEK